MRRTNIYLDDDQLQALDRLAAQEGASRAEVIRRLIDRSLTGVDDDLAADLAAIDDSFGALAEESDVEFARIPDARSAHLDDIWRRTA